MLCAVSDIFLLWLLSDKEHVLIRKYAAAEVGSDAVVCGQNTEA